jgi:phosphoserine phosphatase RsbU/P
LRKPFNPDEIKQFARALTKQWNLECEKEILSAKLAKVRKNEISIASRIQQSLLLGQPPYGFQGIQLAPLTIASQKVDGDFYDFFKHNDQCLDIVLGDVMGKGIPAALVGAATKNFFLSTLYRLYASYGNKLIPEPEVIVSMVKSEMIENLEELETFVTLSYTRFDLLNSKLTFVDCGHMRTIHYQKENGQICLLQGENMPIGFPEKEQIKQITSSFKSGDLFFFYSDGLTEAQDSAGNLFGEDRLIKTVENNAEVAPKELITIIWKEIVDFSKTEVFADDFTCVAVSIE